MIIEYGFTHPNVIPPTRANPSDAGLDIFYSPANINEQKSLEPGHTCLLQTGLRFLQRRACSLEHALWTQDMMERCSLTYIM